MQQARAFGEDARASLSALAKLSWAAALLVMLSSLPQQGVRSLLSHEVGECHAL